jgi:hypothetical protein
MGKPSVPNVITNGPSRHFSPTDLKTQTLRALIGEIMTDRQTQYEFVAVLTRELPGHTTGAIAELACSLAHFAAKHRELTLALCHSEIDQPAYERRQERLRHRLSKLLEVLGIGTVFSSDPRGPTVRLKFRSGRSNTFGNQEWAIPAS